MRDWIIPAVIAAVIGAISGLISGQAKKIAALKIELAEALRTKGGR